MNDHAKVTALPSPADRFVQSALEVERQLGECLDRLDALGLWMAGAHVSRAIDQLKVDLGEMSGSASEAPACPAAPSPSGK